MSHQKNNVVCVKTIFFFSFYALNFSSKLLVLYFNFPIYGLENFITLCLCLVVWKRVTKEIREGTIKERESLFCREEIG